MMYNYYAYYTDKQRARIVKKIRDIYRAAAKDVQKIIDDYFANFARREAFLMAQIETGALKFADEKAAEAYMIAWRRNQLGRGERWKAVQDDIAGRLNSANQSISGYMAGQIRQAAATAHNWKAYTIDCANTIYKLGAGGVKADIAFNIVSEHTVAYLASQRAVFLPSITSDEGKLLTWVNRKTTSELIAGIVSGQSTDKIARRFETVTTMSETAALRNARTALTNAYNAGDQLAAEEAEDAGLVLKKEWRATLDDRTRDSHQQLDGERVGIDERFSNGLLFPGDMSTNDPAETYNCRCTYVTIVTGLNDGRGKRRGRDADGRNVVLDNVTFTGRAGTMSYKDWLAARAGDAQ